MKSQLSNLAKLGSAFLLFILLSSAANAQTAFVTNDTDCDMVVKIFGTDDCSNVACIQTQTVAANTSDNITLPCGSNVVYAEITNPCTTSTLLELATPQCHCGGASTDTDSFTVGAWTVTATSTCSGSDVTIDIVD